jgi:hypothetical protein
MRAATHQSAAQTTGIAASVPHDACGSLRRTNRIGAAAGPRPSRISANKRIHHRRAAKRKTAHQDGGC